MSPTELGYLIAPLALIVILVLMHFGLVARRPTLLWVAVFVAASATSFVADCLCRRRPSNLSVQFRIAQNVAAVTAVIYLSGWGPVFVLAFAFVALENIAHNGSQVWRITLVWILAGVVAGQTAISLGWAPSVLSTSSANALAFMGAFVLFFVIRMVCAMVEQMERADSLVVQSEDRFRSLIQNSSDVTIVVDEGICTYVSPSVTAMLGFDPSELVGRPSADFVHDEDKERVNSLIGSNSTDASHPVAVQFRVRAKDGTFRLVEAVVADQRSRPSVGGFVASIRDITQRTKTAHDLQRSKESFQVLFDQHPRPMWVYDRETLCFLEVNQCAVHNYGYTREEFLSMRITDIRSDEDAEKLRNYMRVERPNLDYAGIWRHRTKAGEIISVDVTTHTLEFRGRRGGLVMAQDVTDRVRLEQELRDRALHDTLTGLPNRTLLLDRVDRLNLQATRSHVDAMVLVLNLDNLKLVNEVYGHDVGDGLIRAVGDRLVNSLQEADTVGRIEGDEFVILVIPPVEVSPEAMAERVLDLVGSEPFCVDSHELRVSTSIGVISGSHVEGAELIQNADLAMRLAKSDGGNRYAIFAQEMQTAVDERVQLTMDLREALGAGQFENFYQPVVRLKDLKVVGVEALVRWRHPTLGLVEPERFIPMAEETGMIRDIGRIVLREACENTKLWQRQHSTVTVAVNVSVFQLRSDEFISDVRDALRCSGLNPSSLVLEVTESILINNPQTVKRLRALKELGVRLAIDDFGTGYSSMSYLRQFPFDILKIDQSFIASMINSPKAITMVRSMIQLGRQLKLDVVAEGVETQQQLAVLRRVHCHNAQGYLFSAPIDSEAMTSLLSAPWRFNRGPSESQVGSATMSCKATIRTSPVARATPVPEITNNLSVAPGA